MFSSAVAHTFDDLEYLSSQIEQWCAVLEADECDSEPALALESLENFVVSCKERAERCFSAVSGEENVFLTHHALVKDIDFARQPSWDFSAPKKDIVHQAQNDNKIKDFELTGMERFVRSLAFNWDPPLLTENLIEWASKQDLEIKKSMMHSVFFHDDPKSLHLSTKGTPVPSYKLEMTVQKYQNSATDTHEFESFTLAPGIESINNLETQLDVLSAEGQSVVHAFEQPILASEAVACLSEEFIKWHSTLVRYQFTKTDGVNADYIHFLAYDALKTIVNKQLWNDHILPPNDEEKGKKLIESYYLTCFGGKQAMRSEADGKRFQSLLYCNILDLMNCRLFKNEFVCITELTEDFYGLKYFYDAVAAALSLTELEASYHSTYIDNLTSPYGSESEHRCFEKLFTLKRTLLSALLRTQWIICVSRMTRIMNSRESVQLVYDKCYNIHNKLTVLLIKMLSQIIWRYHYFSSEESLVESLYKLMHDGARFASGAPKNCDSNEALRYIKARRKLFLLCITIKRILNIFSEVQSLRIEKSEDTSRGSDKSLVVDSVFTEEIETILTKAIFYRLENCRRSNTLAESRTCAKELLEMILPLEIIAKEKEPPPFLPLSLFIKSLPILYATIGNIKNSFVSNTGIPLDTVHLIAAQYPWQLQPIRSFLNVFDPLVEPSYFLHSSIKYLLAVTLIEGALWHHTCNLHASNLLEELFGTCALVAGVDPPAFTPPTVSAVLYPLSYPVIHILQTKQHTDILNGVTTREKDSELKQNMQKGGNTTAEVTPRIIERFYYRSLELDAPVAEQLLRRIFRDPRRELQQLSEDAHRDSSNRMRIFNLLLSLPSPPLETIPSYCYCPISRTRCGIVTQGGFLLNSVDQESSTQILSTKNPPCALVCGHVLSLNYCQNRATAALAFARAPRQTQPADKKIKCPYCNKESLLKDIIVLAL